MEFLKTCNTNAQAIGGFEAVAYQAFSVKRSTTASNAVSEERGGSFEELHAVEAEFWQRGHLVVQDVARLWLWTFRATTPDKAGQTPMASPILEGYTFKVEQAGVMKASELARQPVRIPKPATPSSASSSGSSNSPSTSASSRAPPANARPAHTNSQGNLSAEQQQQHENYAIYEFFISSVVALISYNLVRYHNLIPLNYRTFLSFPDTQTQTSYQDTTSAKCSAWVTSIDAHWTSAGSVVVCTSSSKHPEIHPLMKGDDDGVRQQLLSNCLRVAPNGILARLVDFEAGSDVDDAVSKSQKKRQKIIPVEQNVEIWKRSVGRWLVSKGFTDLRLEDKGAWVKIRVAQTTQISNASPSLPPSREVLWPIVLCFCHDISGLNGTVQNPYQRNLEIQEQSDKSLQWYATPDSSGFQDPLEVAQQWFLGKAEREKALETRRGIVQLPDEDSHPTKDENGGLYPSSPLYSRTSAYGDLQAVSGVYPTPPDGVAQGAVVASSADVPSIQGPTASLDAILARAGNNSSSNPTVTMDDDDNRQSGASLEMLQPFDTQPDIKFDPSMDGGNDDLFEDMDGDVYDGNGVEDADFDFFDEPDGDEMDVLLGNPNAKANIAPTGHTSQRPTEALPDEAQDIKVEKAALTPALETVDLAVSNLMKVDDMGVVSKVIEAEIDQPTAKPLHLDEHQSNTAKIREENNFEKHREASPPLNPELIQQRLLPSAVEARDTHISMHRTPNRKHSIFDPISFNEKISLSDSKYSDGRFHFPRNRDGNTSRTRDSGSAYKDPSPDRAKSHTFSLQQLPLLMRLRDGFNSSSEKEVAADVIRIDDSELSDSTNESSSLVEEDEEADLASIGPGSIAPSHITSIKRKWRADEVATPKSAASFAESAFGTESHDVTLAQSLLQTDDSCLLWFEPSPWDWSLAGLPSPVELPYPSPRVEIPTFSPILSSKPGTPTSLMDGSADTSDEKPALNGKDSIAIAQIVTDQIIAATLDILHEDDLERRGADSDVAADRRLVEGMVQNVVKALFSTANQCTVAGFASVQDVLPDLSPPPKGQPRPTPRRMNTQADGSGSPGHLIYPITPPHIRVRRADTLWDLLPPALSFWEPLGLSPTSAPKNIITYCVYPDNKSLCPCIENFLINVQLVYEGCRFGNHVRLNSIAEYDGGLVPTKVDGPMSNRTALKALRDTCIQLGKLLSGSHLDMRDRMDNQNIDAFVIYMVDPFENNGCLWELCSAFWALFQAYGQGPQNRPDYPAKPDLVLQIIPMKYIASFDTPVMLEASTYFNVAREVYDRCPPSAPSEDKTPLNIYSAPSFQLEEALPRTIQFKLIAEPPQDLLRENSYMHLGYAVTLDGLWVTAAWTDNCGKSQAVVSYNVGSRSFGEVAREIWQTTIEVLQSRRITWRICIAKSGVMEREEIDTWIFLASLPTQLNLFITILTVDISPNLNFTPGLPHNPTTTTSSNNNSSTPVSTPQPGVSPDQPGLTPAATPSESTNDPGSDPDARVVDITDESWGIILSHRLHNSNSTVEYRPALISGLLVKRGETYSTPSHNAPSTLGPVIVGVNILWVGALGCARPSNPSSPFPTPPTPDGVSPSGAATNLPGGMERSQSSLTWTNNAQSRSTAENLLKEILGQYRALGLLARLKGMRGTRHGTVPWHIAAAVRGSKGVSRCA